MQILAENDRGFVGLDGNELIVGSKVFDPPKVRLTSPVNVDGGGGGVISFNISRQAGVVSDGHEQDEMAMIRVEQAGDVRGQLSNRKAELNFMLADGTGVGDVVKPLAFVWNAVTALLPDFRSAINAAFGSETVPTPDPAPSAGPQQITSKDGRYLLVEQDDGNLVVYDRGVAVWDRWSWEVAHPTS